MPPPKSHKKLTPAQKELVKRWIEQGAPYQKHWAFQPLKAPELPNLANDWWAHVPIDASSRRTWRRTSSLLRPRQRRRSCCAASPSISPACRRRRRRSMPSSPTLRRKPTRRSSTASSPARTTASTWRTTGSTRRATATRTACISTTSARCGPTATGSCGAFNDNLPFDQFTVEQLAGDLLPNATRDQQIARGFNRCNVTTSEGGSIDAEYVFRYAVDRTDDDGHRVAGPDRAAAPSATITSSTRSRRRSSTSSTPSSTRAADPAMDGNKLRHAAGPASLTTPEQEKELAEIETKQNGHRQAGGPGATPPSTYTDPAAVRSAAARPRTIETVLVRRRFPRRRQARSRRRRRSKWVTAAEAEPVRSASARSSARPWASRRIISMASRRRIYVPREWHDLRLRLPRPGEPAQGHHAPVSHGRKLGAPRQLGRPRCHPVRQAGTPREVQMGAAAEAGEWVRLEVPSREAEAQSRCGLSTASPTRNTAARFTGTRRASLTRDNPATDPRSSLAAWEKAHQGKTPRMLPADISKSSAPWRPRAARPRRTRRSASISSTAVCRETRPSSSHREQEAATLEKQAKAIEETGVDDARDGRSPAAARRT